MTWKSAESMVQIRESLLVLSSSPEILRCKRRAGYINLGNTLGFGV